MKAAVYTKYGPPEVVTLRDVLRPSPKRDQILVKIYASTVNRNDCGFRAPEYPLIVRPLHGLFRPRQTILGTEFAGTVEEIGSDVSTFTIGDRVFGLTGNSFGTHAEFVCVAEGGAVAPMPENLQFEEAAAICDGPWLALNMLKCLDLKGKRKILVNGASGSIGSACVQLLKYFGAEVVAVCSTRSLEVVKSLGADITIDFSKEDFTQCGLTFDAILDAVGKSNFYQCKPLLKDGGIYISSELGEWFFQNPWLALWTPIVGGKQVRFPIPKLNKIDLLLFKALAEKNKLVAVIDRTYSLADIVEAYRYVETRQKVGNVVIQNLSTKT
jgi:NADPH:quinone reductase-like Zn-dependent oxidoreductase